MSKEPFEFEEAARPDDATENDTVREDPATTAASEPGPEAPVDEESLRLLLQDAVRSLEPSDGVLDHLRRAVPARRARKRQALVGAAAAALLCGTAVPAFMHVASVRGDSGTRTVSASSENDQAQGGMSTDPQTGIAPGSPPFALPSGSLPPAPHTKGGSPSGQDGEPGRSPSGSPTGSAPADNGVFGLSVPACSTAQLGGGSAQAGTPDDHGTVYGTFRVSNVSDQACTVSTPGQVDAKASGAADPVRIAVVAHTAGDPATGLPAPSQGMTSLTLPPSGAYEVKFAFVPSDGCHSDSGPPGPSVPANAGSEAGPGTAGTESGTGTQAQLVREDAVGGGTQEGSIAVSHVPEPGAPAEETTIGDECAGTLYRTDMLPVDGTS